MFKAAQFALYASLADAFVALPRTGPSPIKGTHDIEYIPVFGLDDLPSLHEDLEKYIREAPDAPKCPLTPNGLVRLFAFMRHRHKCKLARSKTPAARGASFVYGAKSFSINLGKGTDVDGGLLKKMREQRRKWKANPPPRFVNFSGLDLRIHPEHEICDLLFKFLAFFSDTQDYLLNQGKGGIDVVNAHVMIYPEGYTGNAHFDTRMDTNTPGSLWRLLVPAKGNEGRPIGFYASHKGPRGWPVLRDARGLALATGPILMNDYGSGGSAVVAAGQAELGHKGSAAAAADIFLGHAPYPKGMPTTARSATVVFTGRERGSGGKRKR